jgi:hypothetical protein
MQSPISLENVQNSLRSYEKLRISKYLSKALKHIGNSISHCKIDLLIMGNPSPRK